MANDIIDITVTDNSDNVQINATPNLVTINVSNTSGNIVGSNYYLVSSYAALPVVGDLTTLYITNDTSLMYRWNGSAYIQVNSVTSWGTITGTLSNQTDLQTALNLKAPLASPTFTGTVSGITKSMVGLSNVDNTSDVNKPISSATQTALDTKAPLASPTFTGTVSGITKSMVGLGNVDNTTDLNKPISTATQAALDGKEPTITAGTSNQYYRGDKTFQSLVTTAVAEGTNLYFTNARSRGAISLTTVGTSGAATYDNATGILNVPAYLGGVTSFNTRTGAITLTSGDVTTALGFTPVTDARTITINGTTYDLTANRSWTIASGVTSFNTRTGEIVPTAGDYTTALVTEDTNLYYTNTRSRNAISLTTTGTSGSATYDNTTGILNIPAYQGGVTSFNTRTGAITLSSSDVTTALGYTPENSANKGIANGYASLDGGGLVPSTQLPSYVDDVLEFADLAAFPASGTTGKIYVALDTNKIYRWSGATYIEVSPSVGTIWGGITGTLSNQTDLQNALNAKQDDLNGTGFVKASGTTISYDNATYYPYPTGNTTQYVSGDGSLIAFPVAGQSGTLVRLVRNQTGATLTKGTVVYISGATGNNPIVEKALATSDYTSAQTFGLCQANIANNAEGYVVLTGDLTGLDTSAFTEGQQLYLSPTTAGTYTATKQYAPNHLVYIGVITRSHPTLGQIEVKIQNGYELDEIHNVSAQSPANNDGIFYNTTTSLWEKKSIATALGFTPYNATNPNNYIALTALSSSATGLTYTNTTGVFSLTAGYVIPTTASATNWDSAYTNRITSLTVTGSSGSATLVSNVLNIPTYTLSGLGGQVALNGTGFVKISGTTISYDNSTYYLASNPSGYTTNVGTVTSIAAITLGTTGTDLSSSVATGTTTPVITLNVPTASATNRGVLSSADWTTFNNKQGTITLTTTGTSGAATLTGSTLNIPQYAAAALSGTTNYVAKFTSSTGIGNSNIFDNGTNVGIGTALPSAISTYTTLDIRGATGGGIRMGVAGNSTPFNLQQAGTDAYLNNVANGAMYFLTNDVERMRITNGGVVQISNAGDAQLHINASGSTGYIKYDNSSSDTWGTGIGFNIATNFELYNFSTATYGFRITRSGIYGTTVSSPRSVFVQSDGTLGGISSVRESKTNINKLDSSWLMQLNPVSFNYRKKDAEDKYTNEHYDELYYGLIAEEAELVNKEICTYNDNKLIGIEYSKLVPVLVKAIQELSAKVSLLENK